MTEDQRHYEVDIIILDTILVRADSAAGARDKARDSTVRPDCRVVLAAREVKGSD